MKGSKYLKYAMDEIVLVVIGILIALSINNWNQQRLTKIEEKKVLVSIKTDFERIREYLTQLNTRRDESLFTFNELIKIRDSKDYSNTIRIDTFLIKTGFTPTFNGNSSAVSLIINSGKMNLISNDSITNLLLRWPEQMENLIEREQDAKDITLGEWMTFLTQHISLNDGFKNYNIQDSPANNRTSQVSKDYKGLFENRAFENTISRLELLYTIGKRRNNGLIESANQIIDKIDNDLKK